MTTPKTGGQPVDEKRWPAVTALVAMPFVPRRCAQRTSHCGYVEVVSIHVVSGLLLVMAIIAVEAWDVGGWSYWRSFSREFAQFIQEFRDPMAWVAAGGTVLGVELGFVIAATLLCAWGAGEEPVRASWARALRRLWLISPVAVWVVLLAVAPMVALNNSAYAYDYEQRRSLYLNEIVTLIGFAGWGWVTWVILAALGAPTGDAAPKPSPPLCEGCGYNLTMAPADSNCPECGKPVRESLAEHLRPGTPWQRRHALGRLPAMLQSWRLALTAPRKLGAQMQIQTPSTDHRWFFAAHLPLFFMVYVAGYTALVLYDLRGNHYYSIDDFWRWRMQAAIFSGMATTFVIALAVPALASVTGLAASLACRRNLLFSAAQASAYLSIYPVIWASITFGLSLGFTSLHHNPAFRTLVLALRIERWQFILLVVVAVQITLLVGYFALMRRIVMATRYANR